MGTNATDLQDATTLAAKRLSAALKAQHVPQTDPHENVARSRTGGVPNRRPARLGSTATAAQDRDRPSRSPAAPPASQSGRGGRRIASVADIGATVRQARERMGLTQARFALLAGVGRRFLSELENGKESLEAGKVLKVMASCGIDLTAMSRS